MQTQTTTTCFIWNHDLNGEKNYEPIYPQAIALSHDHKPVLPKEMERIHDSGGWVENCRVNGSLALSRALGDFKFKQNKKVKAERQIVTGACAVIIA